ncbi:HAMP domain-containing histidine kinase [Sphingomonas parva]|uniref:histidine kinase n=1 Tax=Sphingomonas parva TaxID=2555898 RepID=A0A4Y8ZRW5_9SPHN|nr:ATP-binding protein [Sphingomonas parva]TFI58217.1 HAMP domain-containing histidine kinase [Sphingomonas parva]
MLLHRILAVNIFALAMLAGSLFYLDGFRSRLTAAGLVTAETEVRIISDSLRVADPAERAWLLRRTGAASGTRLRLFRADGSQAMDSWAGAPPTYELRDPAREPLRKNVARLLDNVFDAIVGAPDAPLLVVPPGEGLAAWPEAAQALRSGRAVRMLRRAPEGTLFLSAAARVSPDSVLLLTRNARDIRTIVRDERMTLGFVLLAAILLSVLLSLFLARTIALPLRRLARAAHRVRLGRAREVKVPLLPERRDEIGLLARALHDMTHTLRNRIDATEAFAADVTHELKNPLASLRSAVDTLDRVKDPELQQRLLDVVRHDVARLDRLVVEIAEISRLDAELSRARFEPVDLGEVIQSMLPHWERQAAERQVRIAFARPGSGSAVVSGDESRIARAIDNLVDNAISFSPADGLVEVGAAEIDDQVVVTVEDEGPGVPADKREQIFDRFHSIRPPEEEFGRHSGLGLALARATVEGHGGRIDVEDRHGGSSGARFVIRFPAPAAAA